MPAPMAVRLQILGGTEFASKGYLEPLKPEDVGWSTEDFWPGAMKAVTWDGEGYGVPTNNETMALIWNADIFKRARPRSGQGARQPGTTSSAYSKQIHDKLGVAGYGLVARKNAGNTPYRFMPQLWAYGGGVFDEADPNPELRRGQAATARPASAALQASYDMYVRDKSVPVSALTNQQADNQPLFLAGQLGMMISHPSDYNVMLDLRKRPRAPTRRRRPSSTTCATASSRPVRTASALSFSAAPTSTSSSLNMSMVGRWTSRPRRP